jgi:hypothetical protein
VEALKVSGEWIQQFLIAQSAICKPRTSTMEPRPRDGASPFLLYPAVPVARLHIVDSRHANAIREVLLDVTDALGSLDLDSCDIGDLQEIIDAAVTELDRPHPSVATLGTYLNSLARSLRSDPKVRTVVMELDVAMREANVPTNWAQ